MAKDASKCGATRAVKLFSEQLGCEVSRSTVQIMATKYQRHLQVVGDPSKLASLPHAKRGRPLLLSTDIEDLFHDIYGVSSSGRLINHKMTIATAVGITQVVSYSHHF